MLYFCFILLCLFTRASATCYSPLGFGCAFLDIGSTNCNECTQDTVDLVNSIPTYIGFTQYNGVCGCVVLIKTDCASWGLIGGITFDMSYCSAAGTVLTDAVINNQPCRNCPNSDSTQTSTPTPAAPSNSDSTQIPTPTTTSNSGCIADHQTVTVQGYGTKQIKNLTVGDKVYTDEGFQKYIGNIHDSGIHKTLKLYTENNVHIEITRDHLVKTNGKFVQAYMVEVNDVILTTHGDTKVNKISHGMSIVSSPLTQSGTIIVNNVVLSCYATDRSHYIVNILFYPVRIGIIKNVSNYFRILINIHNAMPKWSKTYISSYSVTFKNFGNLRSSHTPSKPWWSQ